MTPADRSVLRRLAEDGSTEAADRLAETCTWVAPQAGHTRYARDRFGAAHPAADPEFWAGGDSAVTLIRTAEGVLIWLRHDTASPRPALTTHFGLQGTAGAYLAGRHHGESPLIWIEGRSPGVSPGRAAWQPLWDYAREHEPDLWERYGADAATYLSVKPGITGLWQVSGRSQTGYDERVRLDVFYVRNWKLALDLSILVRTVGTVLNRTGAY